jgi:hypothetical protein
MLPEPTPDRHKRKDVILGELPSNCYRVRLSYPQSVGSHGKLIGGVGETLEAQAPRVGLHKMLLFLGFSWYYVLNIETLVVPPNVPHLCCRLGACLAGCRPAFSLFVGHAEAPPVLLSRPAVLFHTCQAGCHSGLVKVPIPEDIAI